MAEYVTVARVDEIPAGEGRAFEVGGRIVAIFRMGDRYSAIDDMCPHMGASLASGTLEGREVSCPWHAWRFDVTDGTWCDNRRLKIDAFDLRVEGDEIQVRVTGNGEPLPRGKDEDEAAGEEVQS